MTAAGPAFILPYNSHDPTSRKEGTDQQKRKIAGGRGSGAEAGTGPGRQRPFSFYRQRETAPPLRDTAGTCTGSGGGGEPPGNPTARTVPSSADLHTGNFSQWGKTAQKKNIPPGPPVLIQVLNFQAARRSDQGGKREAPPLPRCRWKNGSRYFLRLK